MILNENLGKQSNFQLIEVLGKLYLGVFEIKDGCSREITGLCDTTLLSGSREVSGNAPGIPNVQLNIPEFYTLPRWGQLFAFKGNYMHRWFGKIPKKK